jgi:hypothetical protein
MKSIGFFSIVVLYASMISIKIFKELPVIGIHVISSH